MVSSAVSGAGGEFREEKRTRDKTPKKRGQFSAAAQQLTCLESLPDHSFPILNDLKGSGILTYRDVFPLSPLSLQKDKQVGRGSHAVGGSHVPVDQ